MICYKAGPWKMDIGDIGDRLKDILIEWVAGVIIGAILLSLAGFSWVFFSLYWLFVFLGIVSLIVGLLNLMNYRMNLLDGLL